ncbi:hypothetical protein GGQ81_001409 [Sphingomonas desiccabilis]|nr:hypothetical protein [Sphingomonas desiccabilis]
MAEEIDGRGHAINAGVTDRRDELQRRAGYRFYGGSIAHGIWRMCDATSIRRRADPSRNTYVRTPSWRAAIATCCSKSRQSATSPEAAGPFPDGAAGQKCAFIPVIRQRRVAAWKLSRWHWATRSWKVNIRASYAQLRCNACAWACGPSRPTRSATHQRSAPFQTLHVDDMVYHFVLAAANEGGVQDYAFSH